MTDKKQETSLLRDFVNGLRALWHEITRPWADHVSFSFDAKLRDGETYVHRDKHPLHEGRIPPH